MKLIRQFVNDNYNALSLNLIYNDFTLNLFSDASMKPGLGTNMSSCYGAIAVNKDTIIDEMYRFNSNCTVPSAEVRGIRSSLRLALMYADRFRNINIFSDSQLSIFSLRDYIYQWTYNPQNCSFYTKKGNEKVKNQYLYMECYTLLMILIEKCNVNLFHQNGHVSGKPGELRHALNTFRKSNQVFCPIDYNFIRYISMYNNYVDDKSRSLLFRTNTIDNVYRDGIKIELVQNPDTFYN